jgi:hypothetical protein
LRDRGIEKKLVRFAILLRRSISGARARSEFDLINPFGVARVGSAANFALEARFLFAADGFAPSPMSLFRFTSLRGELRGLKLNDGSEGVLLFASGTLNG